MQDGLDSNSYAKYFHRCLALCWLLFCLSLAGPSWNQLPQPVHKEDSALVIVFDLSPSMLAEDISPSRLVRARYKMIDILKARQQGLTGLVVYGGEAFAVSPLTEDSNTIISLAPTLNPTLLPSYGSNTEDGIATAIELINNGGHQQADLLLITDGVARSAFRDISAQLSEENIRLHILGIGTLQGAPIPLGNGGFVKDQNNSIILPRLEPSSLQQLASMGKGSYFSITNNDTDISAIAEAVAQEFPNTTELDDRSFDIWEDRGFWIALLIIPFLLASFRKGAVYVLILGPTLLATQPTEASLWQNLWYTQDQQAQNAFDNGDTKTAQSLFKNTQWQASAAYKNRDFESAAEHYKLGNSADNYYNLGNTLAHMGDLDGAIKAYDQALDLAPEMEDAIANKALIEQLKQQQQQNQSQNGEQQDQSQQSQSQDSQQQQSQSKDGQNQESEQQDQAQQADKDQEESETEEQKNQVAEEKENKDSAEQQMSEMQKSDQEKLEEQQQQELQQWLRRVPDDPGGLLRQKFRYQSQQRASEQRRPPPLISKSVGR